MAKKAEETSAFQDKLKAWWDTDTAKAVATIVAVLLIPASVIAWNYATTQGEDIKDRLNTDSSTGSISADSDNQDENAMESEESEENTEGQESSTNDQAENTDENGGTAIGGLGTVDKLPNTDSTEKYTVVEGDNVYKISMKVCGNESFYKSNTRANYLKVGQTLEVNCN